MCPVIKSLFARDCDNVLEMVEIHFALPIDCAGLVTATRDTAACRPGTGLQRAALHIRPVTDNITIFLQGLLSALTFKNL